MQSPYQDSGLRIMRMGMMDYTVKRDVDHADSIPSEGVPYYPSAANADPVWSVHEYEPLVSMRLPTATGKHIPVVFSAANGLGAKEIAMLGPSADPELIRETIKATLKFSGFSIGTHLVGSNATPELTATIAGTLTTHAYVKIPTGSLIVLDLPDATNPAKDSPKDAIPGKVPFITRPWDPSDMGRKLKKNLMSYIDSPDRWRNCMKKCNDTYARKYELAVKGIVNSYLFAGLAFVYVGMQAGVLRAGDVTGAPAPNRNGNTPDQNWAPTELYNYTGGTYVPAGGPAPSSVATEQHARDVIVKLASYLNIVQAAAGDKSLAADLPYDRKAFYGSLRRAMEFTIFQMHSQESPSVSFARITSRGEHKNISTVIGRSENGRDHALLGRSTTIDTSSPLGQLRVFQSNHLERFLSALQFADHEDKRWLLGKAVKGSDAGRKYDIALGVCRP
jgi:hypothetical protein